MSEEDTAKWEGMKSTLSKWPSMSLDEEGTFKYVLIEAAAFMEGQEEETKLLVRGHGWAEYHADLYEKEEEKLLKAGLDGQCLGGGRIMRTAQKVVVYGYSMGYGRADHQKTVDVIRKHVPSDVEITWNNEGY